MHSAIKASFLGLPDGENNLYRPAFGHMMLLPDRLQYTISGQDDDDFSSLYDQFVHDSDTEMSFNTADGYGHVILGVLSDGRRALLVSCGGSDGLSAFSSIVYPLEDNVAKILETFWVEAADGVGMENRLVLAEVSEGEWATWNQNANKDVNPIAKWNEIAKYEITKHQSDPPEIYSNGPFYWGHYFSSLTAARLDFADRVMRVCRGQATEKEVENSAFVQKPDKD